MVLVLTPKRCAKVVFEALALCIIALECELVKWFFEFFKLETDDVRKGMHEAHVWSNTDVVKTLMMVSFHLSQYKPK
jgi:hypothetical protein